MYSFDLNYRAQAVTSTPKLQTKCEFLSIFRYETTILYQYHTMTQDLFKAANAAIKNDSTTEPGKRKILKIFMHPIPSMLCCSLL